MSTIEILKFDGAVEKANLKIAKAFLRQRYPLSDEGRLLKSEVQRAIVSGEIPASLADQLPVVESPKSGLFQSLLLSSQEMITILGRELVTIQTNYGCREQCTHCFLCSGSNVEIAPYAALFKVGEAKFSVGKKIVEDWKQRCEMLGQKKIGNLYKCPINNYLDNNPLLDYVDRDFLHEDGVPAGYGDVVVVHATGYHPVHISTTVISKRNTIARRAIVRINGHAVKYPDTIRDCRLSVNLKGRMARRGFIEYVNSAIWTIQELGTILTDVDVAYDPRDEKEHNLCRKLVILLKLESDAFGLQPKFHFFPISYYSTRSLERDSGDYDPFGSSESSGYYVLYNGEVMRRRKLRKKGEKGVRPEPTGMWAFRLGD